MVRWNLGAWLGQVHKTLRIIETGGPCDDVAFSPDGRSFATGFIPRDPSLATPIELLGHGLGAKALLVARCLRPVRLPTGRQGPRRPRRPAARRRHRPDHEARALDDPAVTRRISGRRSTSVPTLQRFIATSSGGEQPLVVIATGRVHGPAARRDDPQQRIRRGRPRRQDRRDPPSRGRQGVY